MLPAQDGGGTPAWGPRQGKEARMRSNDAEAPRGIMTELREALDAMPADEPRHDLRQFLPLLVPLRVGPIPLGRGSQR
jgi:hypothetical protein